MLQFVSDRMIFFYLEVPKLSFPSCFFTNPYKLRDFLQAGGVEAEVCRGDHPVQPGSDREVRSS